MPEAKAACAAPSGGQFLLAAPTSIFTPEQFDFEANLMIDAARQFMRGEVMPVLERLDKLEEGLMPALVRKACELGFGGPETPVEYGGLGLAKSLGTRLLEMLSLDGAFSTTFGVQMGIAQLPISLFGTKEQKKKYLPLLTSGEWMGAYALSEPDSGSDALSISTRAVLSDDGREYRLTGTKMWTSNAKWAKLFTVFAKVNREQFTAFLVERGNPGVSIGREERKLGQKGSSTARLILDDAQVPASNLLHREGEGHWVAFNTLNLGRFKLAAGALGQAREAIHQAAKYAKDRKQFGRPIADFGLIRDKFARMAGWFFASESMLYRTGGLIDAAFAKVDPEAHDLPEQNRKASEEYQIECSMGKVLATETLALCTDEALQIHGGYGYTEEFPVARLWRDARVTRIYEGTNEINRLLIFSRVLRRGLVERLLDAEPTCPAHGYLVQAARAAMACAQRDRPDSQQVTAALGDLAITVYAQQAAAARARQMRHAGHAFADFAEAAAAFFEVHSTVWAAGRASEAMSRCGVSQPISVAGDGYAYGETLAEAVLESDGYPLG
ncbi:MAG: acyl-CoA dehydrogenase family protein [Armatimonadetes bacterium]|nr:acyl-CoA dehydrogenase family protein [Armatimonadota bacterium]